MDRAREKRLVLTIMISGAIILLLAPVAIVPFANWLGNRPIPFDHVAWNSEAPRDANDRNRNRMAYALVESGVLIGKSRSEVVKALGESDRPGFHPEMFDATYALGPCGHIVGIDTEFLVLKFNASGQVDKAGIAED